ncbi:T6SS phospholipase effector Tle1-like catalytic domain-containing protein [Actinomycetospora straminea]|uniref:T6SS Phospholipase effector Tle1-like catalytic domain-containing protein n=1 Tax=Actinomycetospora straminea TaxID=663607 RepID=A0ABP9E0Q6_9PSEU|nr:DUF2235 domain-containing protein [Actinomycetospora straminea]MDD7931085.1 DUF2235 domain-containing protein [Actinomycetospora straminea]
MSVTRRLVVCCDGTWNTATDRTNVGRLFDRLAATEDQVPRYFEGLGADGDPIGRVIDGAFGAGLPEAVREVYRWLAETFRPGDELVFLGFSRGAFTVRSTVGMLAQCGLVAFTTGQDDAERTAIVERVFAEGYRAKGDLTGAGLTFHPGFAPDDPAPIAFLGVWDTVGALGVPRTFGLLSGLVGREIAAFHDLELAPDVRHARQALAADERRGPYVPSVWPTPPPGRHASFAQVWFPGGHGDVGGGKPATGLSDGALRWMIDQLDATVAPRWDAGAPPLPVGDPCAPLDDGVDGVWRLLSPRPRAVPRIAPGAPDVSASAVARRACDLDPPYRPGRVLAVGEAAEVAVDADEPWVETGLYLEPGRYALTVVGRWTDHGAASPGTGASPWPVVSWPSYTVGTVLDGVRRLVERVTGNPRSDVVGSRRVPEAAWLELVAAVADDLVDLDGTVREGTTLPIGPTGQRELATARGGYLYAFANDAWTGYGSNGGAVALQVARVS